MKDENFIAYIDNKPVHCEVYYTFFYNGSNYIIFTDYQLDDLNEDRLIIGKLLKNNNKFIINCNLSKEEFDYSNKRLEEYVNE